VHGQNAGLKSAKKISSHKRTAARVEEGAKKRSLEDIIDCIKEKKRGT